MASVPINITVNGLITDLRWSGVRNPPSKSAFENTLTPLHRFVRRIKLHGLPRYRMQICKWFSGLRVEISGRIDRLFNSRICSDPQLTRRQTEDTFIISV